MKFEQFMIRRKVLTLMGASFHFYDQSGNVFAFCRQKAFKLKEDIRIYSDETKAEEILFIKARNIIDFSAAYDVVDSKSGRLLGTWRRKGFSSFVRDSWQLLIDEKPVGSLKEDSMALALVRRLLCQLIPQGYELRASDGRLLASYHQRFNPFVFKLDVRMQESGDGDMAELVAAGGLLLAAIEGRQQ